MSASKVSQTTPESTSPENVQGMPDHAPGLERAFEIEVVEGSWDLEVEGELPSWLEGTYYLNGPSLFRLGDVRYRHWLDGDGAIARLAFMPGGVHFTQRFVDTTKRRDEREAGRALYRAFGTAFEDDRLKRGVGLQSPANVSVHRFAGELLAFGEQGLPYALDPTSLETRGEHTFGGRLNAISPLSAHPTFDPASGEMFNFGISFSARQPSLTLYRFAADGELIYRRRHPLPYPCSTHDFMLSQRHALFYLSPHVLEVEAMLRGGASVMDALAWRPELGGRLLVIDREDGARRAEVRLEDEDGRAPGYCLHLINAFEDEGHLVLDVVELERPVYDQYQPLPELFRDAPRGGPRRLVLDGESFELQERRSIDYELCPDFPAIDPRRAERPYDDLWLLGMSATGRPGRKFFDQLAHLSWSAEANDTWSAPAGCYLGGEPVFLGREGELGQGCVICQVFDAPKRASAFLLFDAFDVAAGPIARLPVPHAMPLGFHTVYYPNA